MDTLFTVGNVAFHLCPSIFFLRAKGASKRIAATRRDNFHNHIAINNKRHMKKWLKCTNNKNKEGFFVQFGDVNAAKGKTVKEVRIREDSEDFAILFEDGTSFRVFGKFLCPSYLPDESSDWWPQDSSTDETA